MNRSLPFDLDHGTDALEPPSAFSAWLTDSGICLSSATIDRLGRYLACLAVANAHMNLTTIEEPAKAWERHVFDALTLSPRIPTSSRTLIDVGSGGGVPGIPLAIAHPELRVTLLEATQKKAAFLSEVVRVLALPNVRVVAERAEQAALGPLRRSFDVVVARAVARLPMLIEWTEPFGGATAHFLFIKGKQAAAELGEAKGILKKRGLIHAGATSTRTGTVLEFTRQRAASTARSE